MASVQVILDVDEGYYDEASPEDVKSMLGDEAYSKLQAVLDQRPAPCSICGVRRGRCSRLGCM